MRIGAFEIHEPFPELRDADAIAFLRPWIDAGSVGTLAVSWLEKQSSALPLGELARPGIFFDFTRYRPTLLRSEGRSHVVLPNSHITTGTLENGKNLLFLHLLEPHMFGEVYVNSIVRLLNFFKVSRYLLVGSMYDFVPHTRPLLVSGGAAGRSAAYQLEVAGVRSSRYEGPTSIASLVTQQAYEAGIESMTMIVHLPQYTEIEEDYNGLMRLLQIFSSLYGTTVDEVTIQRAARQREQINEAVYTNPEMKSILEQLEANYDLRDTRNRLHDQNPTLSPDVERFLREMEKRFGQGAN